MSAQEPHPLRPRPITWPTPWPILRSFVGYQASFIPADMIAGLTLAAIAVPEQMATARLAGFPPQAGFLAFIAGSMAFLLFGGNRLLSCGADSTVAPIFAGALGAFVAVGSPQYFAAAATLAVLVGGLVAAAGLLRLVRIADLLSLPVTVGFLAGVALHIIIGQLPSFLGVAGGDGSLAQRAVTIFAQRGDVNLPSALIGAAVFAVVVVCERISARLPGALIGLAAATCAVAYFGLARHGVAVIGPITAALPAPHPPTIDPAVLVKLSSLSLILALVIMVQTAATTRAFPSQPEGEPDMRDDFIGVGAGSLCAGLFGTFPVNASPPRTAAVYETGGRSQATGLVAVVIIILLLCFAGELFRYVPNAALAGILMFVAIRLVRLRQARQILRQSFPEFALILATAAAIVFLPIEQGAAIGIVLSLVQGVWSTSRARIIRFEKVTGTSIWWPVKTKRPTEHQPGVLVLGFQAPLSFLNAANFRHDIEAAVREAPDPTRLLVLEASGILEVDFTAAQILREVVTICRAQEIAFAVARLESLRAQDAFERFGIADLLGPDHLFHSVDEAVRKLLQA